MKHYQLLILGSGPAGCTAAIYSARAALNFAVIAGPDRGGQIIKAPKIGNWPGELNGTSGMELMEKVMAQARNLGANILSDNITTADLSRHPFYLRGDENEYTCDALIIATGASPKFLGLPAEQLYLGKGFSTCAICDGFFYKNQNVVVIGGGNTAVEEALYLAKIASTVTVIHRHEVLRADPLSVEMLKKLSNVKFEWNHVVTDIVGDEKGVTGVVIKDIKSNTAKPLEAAGVFIAIGNKPNTEIFSSQLEMDQGYIKIGHGFLTATNIPGVFAAGDVTADNYHQAIVAAGLGCTAALDAKNYLAGLSKM